VTVHSHRRVDDGPHTYEELIDLWQSIDEPRTDDELLNPWRPRTSRTIVLARCVAALTMLTILVCLPTVLRAVGGALE
jgi:hypothetical protein